MSEARKSYRAFISYSQQDKVWGKRIHTWLETYRVPVGVMADVGEERRLGRFFRDEDEMPAAPDIGAVVEQAIAAAESLIVICSPCSAESKWVEGEIRAFRRTRPGGKVFAVIIDGSPNSGNPDTECFPDALRLRDDDSLDTLPIEPVGIDVRIDGKDRTCARLAAGILGVDFDDLWQRDRRRNEAQQRRMIVALSVLTLVFAALASAAVWFGVEARRHAAAAEAARANLQREYLRALGEAALDGVLALESLPGTLAMDDPATWTVLMETDEQP
ncbi:MAG: toll/interleukin-1 receptor domain-containing protein, partial [Hyphomonadaceae bacterium]